MAAVASGANQKTAEGSGIFSGLEREAKQIEDEDPPSLRGFGVASEEEWESRKGGFIVGSGGFRPCQGVKHFARTFFVIHGPVCD